MPEFAAETDGLLEVIADKLVALDQPCLLGIDPARKLLVQPGSRRLRERVIGGVPQEEVTESEAIVGRQERPGPVNQTLGNECSEVGLHECVIGAERLESAAVEKPALDRGESEHQSFGQRQSVETGRQ